MFSRIRKAVLAGIVAAITGAEGRAPPPASPPSAGMEGPPVYPREEPGAVKLYSDEEVLDGDGPYPPNDNGSTGLTCAKVLKRAGMISGYQHTFSLDAAL